MPETQAAPAFGRYTDPVMLGQGGMGAVYRATDPMLDRYVAIKVLTQRDPKYVERFRREAQVLAKIVHPAIIQIYEIVGSDEAESDPYIVMEFFEGRALDVVIQDRPLPQAQVVEVLRQVAEGLRKAHANNVVHRDIKPANIMVSGSNEVKILDFGIAKLRDAKTDLTGNTVLGTPYYMSPEQAMGQPIDARTDIYSLGITAFHLLTGRRPFEAKSKVEAMMMQVKTPLPDIHALVECDDRIVQIVRKMCAKKAVERYPGCDQLIDALEALPRSLGGKQQGGPEPAAAAPPRKPARPDPKTEVLDAPPERAETTPAPPPRREPALAAKPPARGRRRPASPAQRRNRALLGGGLAALALLAAAAWALSGDKPTRGQVPAQGWHAAGGMKKLQAAGYANCVFSSRALDRGSEEEAVVRQSFAATEPIHGRCYFPSALGPNRPGEIWQEIWIDGAKRAQVIYDPPIPAEDDQVAVELSKQQGSRLRELSGGKHTLSVWIYRQPEDSDNPIPLAAGELVVRK